MRILNNIKSDFKRIQLNPNCMKYSLGKMRFIYFRFIFILRTFSYLFKVNNASIPLSRRFKLIENL